LREIRRHYFRVRYWRIRISNAQAGTWAIVELSVIMLTITTLLRMTSLEGITAGVIYAMIAYVWDYYESASDLSSIIEKVARVKDIGERVAKG
jgi:MFS superfamily sulfate permease-like transporter